MFEWFSGDLDQGGKTALNIVWNFFGGSLFATMFFWPLALIAGKDEPIKGLEYLFTPFG